MEEPVDDTSVEEICKELQLTAKALYDQTKSCDATYKIILEKLADKSLLSSSHALFPKTAAVSKWLKTLNAPQELITYDEFLEIFFSLYETERRLDFATRTLHLRPKDAKLFGLAEDTPISIYAFLGALPRVFL